MENSKPLATESFSYSWLIDRKPQYSSIFPENSNEKDQINFNFDVPFTASPISLVHADEIFSGGHIMPVYIDRSQMAAWKISNSVPQSPVSLIYDRDNYCLFGKWRKSSKKIVHKFFGFVKPLLVRWSRKSNRVDDLERIRSVNSVVDWSDDVKKIDFYYGLKKIKSWNSSPQASPRIRPSRSTNSCCDVESSIHEAIMYCKKSIEK